jgi:ribosome biogenesis GTPase
LSNDLASLGWDEHFATQFTAYADSHLPGRISRVDRGALDVMTAFGPLRVDIDTDEQPAIGDWVAILDDCATDVLARKSTFVRGTASGTSHAQVIAANVDTVFITVPLSNAPKLGLVERYVSLVWESGATPVVLLTKADLVTDIETPLAEASGAAPGVDVFAVSVVTGAGIDDVAGHVAPGRTVAFVGPSGAGKSSLVNELMGSVVMLTQDIRGDGKGRHTTSHRELVVLPAGGVLIDTPGLRGVALYDVDAGLDQTFADVEDLVDHCKFTDCRHDSEPGCAVLAAVGAGSITQRRLDSWRKLRREAAWIASRTDARLRAERKREWQKLYREIRHSGRARP